ncbi:MAG: adenylate/guanylate cyclase domain-containing protein [Hyphomicrobiaceae bacterium]
MKRRLTAMLAADVVGYSRLIEEDEMGTLQRLTELREKTLVPLIGDHRGRIVKLMGDGFLLEFQSVVDAVECAVSWQLASGECTAGKELNRPLQFRIGVNLGDVIVEGEDIYGEGVNVAARLEALAEPGGICASRAVFEQIRNRLDLDYTDLGDVTVKNIAEPVHAYQIHCRPALRRDTKSSRNIPPQLDEARASIAVFPFDKLSSEDDDSFLAEGIAMEIISMLSRVPDLRVASRPATFGSQSRGDDKWEIVSDLKLRYVLTGSVRRAKDRIRVIAELSDAADRSQLWSHMYERQLADIFSVQEEIAEAIVVEFGGEYLRAEWQRAKQRPTDSLDAWGLVQKARAQNLPVHRQATEEALQMVLEAIKIDPYYAGAYARLASTLMQRVISGTSKEPNEDRKNALAAVERAMELAADDPSVLRTLGNVLSNCGKHDRAVRALRRAVEIAPFDFHSWGRLGRTLCYAGGEEELREGHAVLDRILAAAPNHPMVPYWLYFKANACSREGRYEDAVDFARKSADLQPGYAGAWITLANGLGQLGQLEPAGEAMDRALRANPTLTPQHLAEQIRVLADGRQDLVESSLSGLKAAGLLD